MKKYFLILGLLMIFIVGCSNKTTMDSNYNEGVIDEFQSEEQETTSEIIIENYTEKHKDKKPKPSHKNEEGITSEKPSETEIVIHETVPEMIEPSVQASLEEITMAPTEALTEVPTEESATGSYGVIPSGCTYIIKGTGVILGEGDYFPEKTKSGDIYTSQDYYYYNTGTGWRVKAKENKMTYEEILSSISGSSITNMENTFYECTNMIVAPQIPATVDNMYGTFDGCTSLNEVQNLPEGIKELVVTFRGCSSLEYAPEIPSSVTNLNGTFANCSSLKVASNVPAGVTNMIEAFYNCTSLEEAPELPEGVTDLFSAFSGCSSLKEAPIIPDSVTNLCRTFYHCSSLEEAPEIPAGVTNISHLFEGCLSLVQVGTIPEGVESMNYTFDGCENLQIVQNVPSTVKGMQYAFRGCKSLTGTIIIDANPEIYDCCFLYADTDQDLVLTGLSNMLAELKRTGWLL